MVRSWGSDGDGLADVYWMLRIVRAPVSGVGSLRPSIIEFFILSSLVGVVSAFAIPRYTWVGNEARATQVLALNGLLRRVAGDAHSQFLRSGGSLSAATLQGKAVILKDGYPEASANGIRAGIIDGTGFIAKTGPDSVVFMKQGSSRPEQCAVTYIVPKPAVTWDSMVIPTIVGC